MIMADILVYMEKHPNQEIHISTMAKSLKLTSEQVSSAMWRIKEVRTDIQLVRNGYWIYRGIKSSGVTKPPKPVAPSMPPRQIPASQGEIFEAVGADSQGRTLLKSESGVIGRFEPL